MANRSQGRHVAPKHAAPKSEKSTAGTRRALNYTQEPAEEDLFDAYSHFDREDPRPAEEYFPLSTPEMPEEPVGETYAPLEFREPQQSHEPQEYTESVEDGGTPEEQEAWKERLREQKKAPVRKGRPLGKGARFLIVLASLFVFGCIAGFGTVRMITHGPSRQARILFVRTLDDTTTLRKVPYLFLSKEDVLDALDTGKDSAESAAVRYGMEKGAQQVVLSEESERPVYENMIELSDISGANWKGKMLVCHDPKLLVLGTPNDTADQGYGKFLQVQDYVDKCGGIAGTTAAGFRMTTNTPYGFVVNHGELLYSESDKRYNVVAFDADHIMTVGPMTAQDAVDAGYDIAVCWKPILIQDGVKKTGLGGGFNPRAAIGQTADGTIVLVVIEGRMISSLGATLDELADFMEEQGCINAMNLDSGKSSILVYGGEQLTTVAIGSGLRDEYRALPNAFVVLPEE